MAQLSSVVLASSSRDPWAKPLCRFKQHGHLASPCPECHVPRSWCERAVNESQPVPGAQTGGKCPTAVDRLLPSSRRVASRVRSVPACRPSRSTFVPLCQSTPQHHAATPRARSGALHGRDARLPHLVLHILARSDPSGALPLPRPPTGHARIALPAMAARRVRQPTRRPARLDVRPADPQGLERQRFGPGIERLGPGIETGLDEANRRRDRRCAPSDLSCSPRADGVQPRAASERRLCRC